MRRDMDMNRAGIFLRVGSDDDRKVLSKRKTVTAPDRLSKDGEAPGDFSESASADRKQSACMKNRRKQHLSACRVRSDRRSEALPSRKNGRHAGFPARIHCDLILTFVYLKRI